MFFYVPNFDEWWVDGEEARVMFAHRLTRDQSISITDLKGTTGTAIIEGYDKQLGKFRLRVVARNLVPRPEPTVIFQALLDKVYMDQWAEVIGLTDVTEILLYKADHSQPKALDPSRLLKKIQHSVLLSERAWMPAMKMLNTQAEFATALNDHRPVILHQDGSTESQSINHICVGPEGGYSRREEVLFDEIQLTKHSLSSHILPGWLAGFSALTKH